MLDSNAFGIKESFQLPTVQLIRKDTILYCYSGRNPVNLKRVLEMQQVLNVICNKSVFFLYISLVVNIYKKRKHQYLYR